MQKVLIAGSTGYLGKYVVREFKKQGYWIRALARNSKKLEEKGRFLEPAVKNQIDEIFVGEVTKPETLYGLCNDIDVVFSSIGITRQMDKVSFMDVDYLGNKNILDLALEASVKKFIFVSVFNADLLKGIDIVKARELFVEELQNSLLEYTVIRPTGYFSDMSEFLKMAKSGRVYLIGEGKYKINPIHGADLAKVCVAAVGNQQHEISVGGPVTYTYEEIAELAFSVIGKPLKITGLPAWLVNLVVKMIRPFSRHYYTLNKFSTTVMQLDFDAPKTGTHTLDAFYKEIALQSGENR